MTALACAPAAGRVIGDRPGTDHDYFAMAAFDPQRRIIVVCPGLSPITGIWLLADRASAQKAIARMVS
jgi:hypothetical protein